MLRIHRKISKTRRQKKMRSTAHKQNEGVGLFDTIRFVFNHNNMIYSIFKILSITKRLGCLFCIRITQLLNNHSKTASEKRNLFSISRKLLNDVMLSRKHDYTSLGRNRIVSNSNKMTRRVLIQDLRN